MAEDTKKIIAEAGKKLLFENNIRKLTVTDIVAECKITRQTFYYHFEDIPALIRWILEKDMKQLLEKMYTYEEPEKRLRYCFLVALNALPYVEKGMQTNYRDEIEKYIMQYIYRFAEQMVEIEDLYRNYSRSDLNLILRYHSSAILGLLITWTEEDSKNLDRIIHQVYGLLTGKINPFF